MAFKKIVLLAAVTPLVLGGCTKEEDKEIFLSNYHYLETVLPEEKDRVITSNIVNVKEMLNLSISFFVYFHKPDCYWCEQFSPILNDYLTTHETLVVDVPYESIWDFKKEFGNLISIDESFSFPYFGVMHGTKQCEKVANDQYMQTSKVFTNYMEKRVKKTHIYYSDKNEKSVKNNRKISNISINTNEKSSLDLYNQKVYSVAIQSKADILITGRDESGLFLQAIDENQTVKEKTQVTNETESSTIQRYF